MTVVDDPEKQHEPLAPDFCPIHISQLTGPPSGSVAGKLTVIVLPAGASVGDTVSVPVGVDVTVGENSGVGVLVGEEVAVEVAADGVPSSNAA